MDENRCIALIKDIYKLGIPNNITLAGNDIKEAKESLEAFYNSNGGIIIFGINKDLKQIRINTKTIIGSLKAYNDNLTSSNPLVYKSFKYNDKEVLLFEIKELSILYKPTHNIKLNDIDSLIRINDKNETITYSKLYSLYAFKGINEEEISKSYLYDDRYNDEELFNNFILKYRELNRTIDSLDTESIVSYLRLVNDSYKTLAYVLTFSTYPQVFYPYLFIAIYKITSSNNYILLEKIDGSISTMFYKTMLIIKKHLNYELSFVDGKLNTNTTFPISSIEEALFNALTLRDYSPYGIVSPIKIYLSDTKIKITNPGGYIYDGTFRTPVEKLIRNPLIKQMNAIILGRDELTNGMNRIFNLLKISGYTEPIIESYNNTFSITMTNESIIHIYNGLNIEEVCEFCKTPRSKEELYQFLRPNKKGHDYTFMVRKYIYPLIELNILEFTIPDRPQSKNQRIKTTDNYLENIKNLN